MNSRTSLNVPSSNGVSATRSEDMINTIPDYLSNYREYEKNKKNNEQPGPKITAFHDMTLSGQGAPEIPAGGSF